MRRIYRPRTRADRRFHLPKISPLPNIYATNSRMITLIAVLLAGNITRQVQKHAN